MPSSDSPNEPAVATDTRKLARIAGSIARWDPYLVPQFVVASAIALDLALPQKVTIGPSWLLPSFEGLLLLGLTALTPHPRMRHSPARRYGALAVIDYIETFYNPTKRHSSLGQISPVPFETKKLNDIKAA